MTQISFHCTAELSNLIHTEKVRRGLTIQKMIEAALVEYWRKPAKPGAKAVASTTERERFLDLAKKYYQEMPDANRRMLEEFFVVNLKHYRSSRVKTTARV